MNIQWRVVVVVDLINVGFTEVVPTSVERQQLGVVYHLQKTEISVFSLQNHVLP